MLQLLLAFGAGLLTALSPCAIPLIPIVAGGAATYGRAAVLALLGGLLVAFNLFTILIATAGFIIPRTALITTIGGLLVIVGAALLSPKIGHYFELIFAKLARKAESRISHQDNNGVASQFIIGFLLGAVWSPCSGPTIASVGGLIASHGITPFVLGILGAFSIGAAIPLFMLGYFASHITAKHKARIAHASHYGRTIFGMIIIVIGLSFIFGLDKQFEAFIVEHSPDWLINLQSAL